MKSRSSTGVGMKIDLDYNIETMRITDPGVSDTGESQYRSTASAVMEKIKTSATVRETEQSPPRGATVETNKLKQMLAGLKSSNV